MKWIFPGLIFVLLLGGIFLVIQIRRKRALPATPLFPAEKAKGITLFWRPDNTEGLPVPEEWMEEMTAWIGNFTLGQRERTPKSGSNRVTFRLETHDGRVITNGFDTVTCHGKIYRLQKPPAPACFSDLLRTRPSHRE